MEEEFKEYVGGNLKDFTVLDAFDSLFLNGKANQEAQFQQFASLEIHPTQQIKRTKITEPKKAHIMMELQVKSLQNPVGHLSEIK